MYVCHGLHFLGAITCVHPPEGMEYTWLPAVVRYSSCCLCSSGMWTLQTAGSYTEGPFARYMTDCMILLLSLSCSTCLSAHFSPFFSTSGG